MEGSRRVGGEEGRFMQSLWEKLAGHSINLSIYLHIRLGGGRGDAEGGAGAAEG